MGMNIAPVEPALAAVLIFVGTLLVNLVASWVRSSKAMVMDARKAELSAEIAELRKEAAQLNTPATYAKCAKCQRSIAAKEKELLRIESPGMQARSAGDWKSGVLKLIGRFKWTALMVCAVMYYGEPLVYVDTMVVSPMNRMLSMPHGKSFSTFGAVAVIPWMVLCNKSTNMLCDAVMPSLLASLHLASGSTALRTTSETKKDL